MLENQGVGASFVLVHINIECILFIDNIKEAFCGFSHLGFPRKNIVLCLYVIVLYELQWFIQVDLRSSKIV